MKRVARIGGAALLAAMLFVAGGIGLFRSGGDGADAHAASTTSADTLLAPAISGSLEQIIENLQSRLRVLPTDWQAFASLGLAYVQQARVTADPSYYPKAQGVLERSLGLERNDNFAAMVGMAALAAARHDFAGALRWGEQAKAINPYNGNVYGVIGDAQVELGRYQDAFATFQKMVDTLPGVASYARVSYARELMGDVPGAIKAMEAARDIAGTPADSAWADYQLGELYFNQGNLDDAQASYARGVATDADYVPPFAGLAKVAWARGHLRKAIAGYTDVVSRYPSPEYVIALGDLYTSAGQTDRGRAAIRARPRRGTALPGERREHRPRAGPVRRGARRSCRRVRRPLATSGPSGTACTWPTRTPGLCTPTGAIAEAAVYARKAMSLGYRNALFAFHAGMIQLDWGTATQARRLLAEALDINPHFSIQYAPVAQATLTTIGGAA